MALRVQFDKECCIELWFGPNELSVETPLSIGHRVTQILGNKDFFLYQSMGG